MRKLWSWHCRTTKHEFYKMLRNSLLSKLSRVWYCFQLIVLATCHWHCMQTLKTALWTLALFSNKLIFSHWQPSVGTAAVSTRNGSALNSSDKTIATVSITTMPILACAEGRKVFWFTNIQQVYPLLELTQFQASNRNANTLNTTAVKIKTRHLPLSPKMQLPSQGFCYGDFGHLQSSWVIRYIGQCWGKKYYHIV